MAAGDDAGKVPTGCTREVRRGEWWVREDKKKNKKDNFGKSLDPRQSRHKICSRLRVYEKYITFHIKSWFSDFIKLGLENHIFPKWPHQNTSFPKRN